MALLRPTRLLISEKSATYTINDPVRLFGRLEYILLYVIKSLTIISLFTVGIQKQLVIKRGL